MYWKRISKAMSFAGMVVLVIQIIMWHYLTGGCFKTWWSLHLVNNSRNGDEADLPVQAMRNVNKDFIYLVQTSKCLPKNLLKEDVFNNESSCDVIVLSFKEECLNEKSLAHIEYIHALKVTWSQGRNILYRKAQARNLPYLYYIFLDGDLQFAYSSRYASATLKSMSPLRAFEAFLVSHEPAVGVANYQLHHNADSTINTMNKICTDKKKDPPPQHITVVFFDASFNAFHRDAIQYILPYVTKYDHFNWHHSQRHVIAEAELLFRGQTIMYTPVEVINPQHGPYPQNYSQSTKTLWSEMVKTIKYRVPKEYQNQSWILEFTHDPEKYLETSPALCMALPPHQPIIPFSHFTFKINSTSTNALSN